MDRLPPLRPDPGPRLLPAARVAAVALLAFALLGLASLVGLTDRAEPASGASATGTRASSGTSTKGVKTTGTTSASGPTVAASATTTTRPPGPPRVYVAGDSTAQGYGGQLDSLLQPAGIQTTVDYKVSSGLTRPDFFDWPARIRAQVAALSPDVVVVTFGGNDAQGIKLADGTAVPMSDKRWTEEYGRRVNDVMTFLQQDGRKVVWVGVPQAANAEFNGRLTTLRNALLAQVSAHPGVTFVDPWTMFSSPVGSFAPYVVDDDGKAKPMRAIDGYHLNVAGSAKLARAVARVVAPLVGQPVPEKAAQQLAPGATGTYKVEAGDAFAAIAAKLGVPLEVLLAANNAKATSLIVVGQGITVPAAQPAAPAAATGPAGASTSASTATPTG